MYGYSKNGDCVNGVSAHTLDSKHLKRIRNIQRVGGFGKVIYAFIEQNYGHEPRIKKITDNGIMIISNALYDESDYTSVNSTHIINYIICGARDILHFKGFCDKISNKVIKNFPNELIAKCSTPTRKAIILETLH